MPCSAPRPTSTRRWSGARRLRALLWEADWGRYGWPEEYGGRGGSSLHRAAVHEELFRAGWHGPAVFEHVEIIAPTLVRYAQPAFLEQRLPRFLDGAEVWSQGFSEPEAGSDLASLRTRAVEDGDAFVVNGSKIWTSWSKWARWCLALVRTGTADERHRGLTMMAIDLTAPGVRVRPIRQANGTDELAQVFLDDVRVPRTQLVGEPGEGWAVAMYLLARERGTLSWLRHCGFRRRLLEEHKSLTVADDRAVGDFVAQWAGVRAAAADLLHRDAAGQDLGPESAFNKLLMTRAEQELQHLVHDATGPRVGVPVDEEDLLRQREYLFSRIVTVYGGSQQMQLITIAKHVLGLGRG
ncbi:acyl-CoA dehydrogenase family protein [Nocardioides sp. TF02-7]|uniref:acyl-CoA dehydrogenase family protein n=1 Tax=Nocardioides sp. TF02-7 TaxID=2917724 RepID=UPI001F063C53|nr:acyl-CoA dehydrogenase family protein [Nocardioides sp. TF02-7]UMG91285.1 acyl-CoA dehydrogenase family protein [Nocardioides sp. TF02-7]